MKTMKNYFYHVNAGNYIIADTNCYPSSINTYDIKLFDLANKSDLLNVLNLAYISTHDKQANFEWFCNYLCQMMSVNTDEREAKMLTNPTVRILFINRITKNQFLEKL